MNKPHKPGSKAYRRQLRSQLTNLGFHGAALTEKIVDDLTAQCDLHPRASWRLANELSLDEAATKYNDALDDPSSSMRGARIWDYEQWPDRGVRPTLRVLKTLAGVYGTNWTNLLTLHDLARIPGDDLAAYHEEKTRRWRRREHDASSPTRTGEPAAALAAMSQPPASAAVSLRTATDLTTTNVDEWRLEDLHRDLTFVGNSYVHSDPRSVARELSTLRDRITGLLQGRQRPAQTTQLLVLGARCCAMLAWAFADLGHYGAGKDQASAAWLLAQQADDNRARRWVRAAQSRVAFWAGNVFAAAQLAEDGLRYPTTELPDFFLVLQAARGWGSASEEQEALCAVARWRNGEEAGAVSPDEDAFFNVTRDRQHYVAGGALLAVGRHDEALAEFANARACYDDLSPRLRWPAMDPMIRVDTTRAHLRRGELDGALEALDSVFTGGATQKFDMIRSAVQSLRADLNDTRWRGDKTAQALTDRLVDNWR